MDTRKHPEETETQYVWRICSAKDTGILDITWDEVASILNKELRDEGEYYTSSAYRKKYQQAKLFRDEVFSKETDKESEQKYDEQKRELERLKIAYRDERRDWQKQNYTSARINQQMDYLAEQLQQIGRKEFLIFDYVDRESTKDMIVCLSDLHIGQTFDNKFGKYNSDIAKERLEEYLDKIVEIGETHNIENVYVALLGDLLSGNIHLSIQVSNRENIIDQIKLSAEYIANFCMELAERFKHVNVFGVSGNHSRLVQNKELDIKDERLDSLILWITQQMLGHVKNVTVNTDNLDSTIAEIKVRGKDYAIVHGDTDSWSANDVSKLSMMLKKFPYAIINGHKHFPAYKEINGIKLIQSGSLASGSDDYCIQKRLSGNPNQTVLVCDEYGIDAIYNVDLS
jgi:predicted phosphodiesterase